MTNPTYISPDPREIAEDLRQRLLDEEWPENKITTQITCWADGDIQVEAWHSMDRHQKDPPARVVYTYTPDGSIHRHRNEMVEQEQWKMLDCEVVK
jgi:hypothetical protein